ALPWTAAVSPQPRCHAGGADLPCGDLLSLCARSPEARSSRGAHGGECIRPRPCRRVSHAVFGRHRGVDLLSDCPCPGDDRDPGAEVSERDCGGTCEVDRGASSGGDPLAAFPSLSFIPW